MVLDRVLVVDDDKLNVELLTALLEREGCRVTCAYDGRQGWKMFQKDAVDLIFMDLRMPRMGGMELLEKIKGDSPRTPIVMMTAYATVETAVESMRLGAYDFITKPFTPEQVSLLLRRLRERNELYAENDYLREELAEERAPDRLLTSDEKMLRICEAARLAAQSKASVLIQGESGTGKELVARHIHRLSPRNRKPFVRVNCAALPETLLESELFGHEKGAFTGAVARRRGRFELADGGTLLLDEVSEISSSLQAKLLRAIEQEEFERVGGSRTLRVDVRIVATTNRDLRAAIEEGDFRADLFYRLNVVPIVLPPLRDRPGDIAELIAYYLEKFALQGGRAAPSVSRDAMRVLRRYSWPGNVRELKNVVQRMMILCPAERIEVVDLPSEVRNEGGAGERAGIEIGVGQTLEAMERTLILKTLERTGGNRTDAAEILGVTTRTLRNKLRRYREKGLLGAGPAQGRGPEKISPLAAVSD